MSPKVEGTSLARNTSSRARSQTSSALFDEHGAMTAADVLRGQQGERLVLVGTQVVAAELLGLADEVHRERIDVAAVLRLRDALGDAGQGGRIEPTR